MNEGFQKIFEGLSEILSHGGELMLAVLAFVLFFIVVACLDGCAISRERAESPRRQRKGTRTPQTPVNTPDPTGPSSTDVPSNGNRRSQLRFPHPR